MWWQETFRIASHGRYSIGEMIGKVHTDRSVFGWFPPFFASKSLCCMEDWWKNVVFMFHPQQKHRSVTMDLWTMEFCWIFLDVVSLSFLHNSEGHLCHRLQWTLSHYRAVCGHQKDCHQQLRNCGKNGETYWWKYIEMHCRICSLQIFSLLKSQCNPTQDVRRITSSNHHPFLSADRVGVRIRHISNATTWKGYHETYNFGTGNHQKICVDWRVLKKWR